MRRSESQSAAKVDDQLSATLHAMCNKDEWVSARVQECIAEMAR